MSRVVYFLLKMKFLGDVSNGLGENDVCPPSLREVNRQAVQDRPREADADV